MKDFYYMSIITVLIWSLSMAIVLGRKQNNNYNSRYVLTLQAQLVKSANLMEQFKFRSDNIILLANQASAITEKAQKDLQQCRTAGWHVF